MVAREGSDPQRSGGKPESSSVVRLILLSLEVNFDWNLFDLYLRQQLTCLSVPEWFIYSV